MKHFLNTLTLLALRGVLSAEQEAPDGIRIFWGHAPGFYRVDDRALSTLPGEQGQLTFNYSSALDAQSGRWEWGFGPFVEQQESLHLIDNNKATFHTNGLDLYAGRMAELAGGFSIEATPFVRLGLTEANTGYHNANGFTFGYGVRLGLIYQIPHCPFDVGFVANWESSRFRPHWLNAEARACDLVPAIMVGYRFD